MTKYQVYMRLRHLIVARHFRGHGIHSPYLYDFIRNVLMNSCLGNLAAHLVHYYSSDRIVEIRSLDEVDLNAYIVVLREPFARRCDWVEWRQWRDAHECLSVWLNGCIVIFFDKRLNNQHFTLRS